MPYILLTVVIDLSNVACCDNPCLNTLGTPYMQISEQDLVYNSLSFLLYGSQSCEAYSRSGRMLVEYTVSRVEVSTHA